MCMSLCQFGIVFFCVFNYVCTVVCTLCVCLNIQRERERERERERRLCHVHCFCARQEEEVVGDVG